MHSYYFKNFILASLLMMSAFIILSVTFLSVGRSVTMKERWDSIDSNVSELSKLSSAYAGELDSWPLRMTLTTISQSTGNRSLICDSRGRVISCSDTDFSCGHIGKVIAPEILQDAADGDYHAITTLGDLFPAPCYVAALPVADLRGYVQGFVFVSSDNTDVVRIWSSIMDMFLLTALAILALTLIISFFNSRHLAKPINEMADAADKFAHGDFSTRVTVRGDDEIGALSNAFNKMADSLEQSEQRRSEFLANVAHELKTPMTTISGFADGILDGTIPPESQRQYLETISSETKRLNRLVRRMLDLSRMQHAGPEELRQKSFDAGELLLQTLLVFEKKINDKSLEVNALVPEDSILVLGDADAINQVIYNLLENAVKFAVPGSELSVNLFKQGDKAYISVKNHGDTIPEEELALIFDRFHKTDKSRSIDRDGVGLGLYIVKSILNNHGEDIVVTSRDGVTEFCFSLTLKPGK